MKRIPALALVVALAACGDVPTEPEFLSLEPAFDIHSSPTAGDLDDPNDAYDEVAPNTFQRHTAGAFNGDRFYMRTTATDFNEQDFVAELVFTLTDLGPDGATITYFGMGPGTPDAGYHNESSGVLFRIHSADQGGFTHFAVRNEGGSWLAIGDLITGVGPSGAEHRVILAKSGSAVTLAFDVLNDGTVDATQALDLSAYPLLNLDNTNSRIYFGTSTQDRFTLNIDLLPPPPPPVLDPTEVDQCKKGGWEGFGFRNQGQCIRFVNTGKDSR